MAKLIKSKTVKVEAEFTERGVIAYPRFYIKAVGGMFSFYHKLTHSYLGCFKTEEELVAELESWFAMSEEVLWEQLLSTRGFSVSNLTGAMRDKFFEHDEDWYLGAWGIYTTKFYKAHPQLLQESKVVPMQIINAVRQKMNAKTLADLQAHNEHIAKVEESYNSNRVIKKEAQIMEEIAEEKPPVKPVQTVKKKPLVKKATVLPSIIMKKTEEKPKPKKKVFPKFPRLSF